MNIIADALNYIDDELIFCALNASAEDGKGRAPASDPKRGRSARASGGFAARAAAIASASVAAALLCAIIIIWAIVVFSGANSVAPNAPVYYSLGEQITDVNGNTVCLDSVSLDDGVTIGGETYTADEGGAFLIVSGTVSATEFDVSLSDMTYTVSYGSDGSLFVRADLFEYYVDDDGAVEGEVVLVYEVDAATLQTWRDELTAHGGEYVYFTLTFEDFVQSVGQSIVPAGYDFILHRDAIC